MSLTHPNFRMPAEWEPHEATWLSWPHNQETWPEIPMERVESVWVQMVLGLVGGEIVHLNVNDQAMEEKVRALLQNDGVDLNKVRFHHFPTNDAWARDHGPIFIIDESEGENQLVLLNWEYNSWGGKYPPYDLDNAIPSSIARQLGIPMQSPGIVLEGGSIEVNGRGTLFTTESCLLNSNRNPHLTREQIESYLTKYLGIKNILWLGDGIIGDDTDGHIDDLTRFVDASTVVTALETNPGDENYQALQENFIRLQSMRSETGQTLKVIPLPMPAAIYSETGRLPASYANFYIGNKAVLVPVFQDRQDEVAIKILQGCFPSRRMVPIDGRILVHGLGACHCVTQQQPALLKKN